MSFNDSDLGQTCRTLDRIRLRPASHSDLYSFSWILMRTFFSKFGLDIFLWIGVDLDRSRT